MGELMLSVCVKLKNLEFLSKFPWRVGIVGFMAYPETLKQDEKSIEATTKLLEEEIFDIVEFHALKYEVWKKIAKMLNEKGVELVAALQPTTLLHGYSLSSIDENKRKEAVKVFKEQIEKAHTLEISKIALCSGPDPGIEKRNLAKRALISSLKELCDLAKSYDMNIYLENFDRDYDKKLLLGPTSETVSLIKEIRKEFNNLWLLWDLSHAPLLNETPEVLKNVSDVLGHIHIGCAEKTEEGLKDYHPGFYTKGAINDVVDVMKLLQVLLEVGYCGAVSFEIKPKENEKSELVINTAKGVLYTAFCKLLKRRFG